MSDSDKPELILLDIPADIKYLETVTSVLGAVLKRIDEQEKEPQSHFAVKLSVHEACANIIEHAYHGNPGRIKAQIFLYLLSKKIVIELFDQGDAAELSHTGTLKIEQPQIR